MIIVSMRSPFINPRVADLVTDYLESKKNDRVVPLVGCAAHRLNLGVNEELLWRSKISKLSKRSLTLII